MKIKELQTVLNNMMSHIHEFCKFNDISYSLAYGTLLGAIRHRGFIPWDDDVDIFMLPEDFKKMRRLYNNDNDLCFLQNKKSEPNYYLIFDKIRLLCSTATDANFEKYAIRDGIFIDIFPLYYVPTNKYERIVMLSKLQLLKYLNLMLVLDTPKYSENISGKFATVVVKIIGIHKLNSMMIKIQDDLLSEDRTDTVVDIEFKPIIELSTKLFEEVNEIPFEEKRYFAPKDSDRLLKIFYGDYTKIPPESEQSSHETCVFSLDKDTSDCMISK